MNKITDEELKMYSAVYDVYMLYSEEDKKRIPKKFINKLKAVIADNSRYVGKIKSFYDLKNSNLSRATRGLIVYMGLNI